MKDLSLIVGIPPRAVGTDGGPALDEALASLRDTHRQCFILREIEGRSYEDIAEIMDMPRGTASSHVTRARGKLRAALGPAYDALRASSITPS